MKKSRVQVGENEWVEKEFTDEDWYETMAGAFEDLAEHHVAAWDMFDWMGQQFQDELCTRLQAYASQLRGTYSVQRGE